MDETEKPRRCIRCEGKLKPEEVGDTCDICRSRPQTRKNWKMIGTKPYRGINDPERIITCRLCGQEQSVAEIVQNDAECTTCLAAICAYCGCSDERGCIHPSFPNGELNCEWKDQGLCNFCFQRLAEEQFYLATGQAPLIVPIAPVERPLILAASL